ncbi:hypothetical protein AB1Y20_016464 [Prymnesium parvum]|uniref:Uncharacterized protein n=1 Tax=Prymnesium parvum TaxID=97485 RepID=A0AB34ICT2_PRYPA
MAPSPAQSSACSSALPSPLTPQGLSTSLPNGHSGGASGFQLPLPAAPPAKRRPVSGGGMLMKHAPPNEDDATQFSMDIDEPASTSILPPQKSISGPPHLLPKLDAVRSRSHSGSRRLTGGTADPGAVKKARRSGGSSSNPASQPPSQPPSRPPSNPTTPNFGPLSVSPPSSLMALENDLQSSSILRHHEFQSGRRVFHVHFGHGYVKSLEAEPRAPDEKPELHRVLGPRTHNINCLFDNTKYKQLRLRAFYAVPKMVVIPSTASLRKRKFVHALEATPPDSHARISLVRQLLASSSLREACSLVQRWHLQHAFEPTQLLQRLVRSKQYGPALRFAREFGLMEQYPTHELLLRMVEEKRYDGVLKFVSARTASVDGQHAPADVVQMLVLDGKHELALKYVHKFGAEARFPPAQLVEHCLQQSKELTVRASAMLLKYVKVFQLEATYPMDQILERVTASGIIVHDLDGRYILKGRRRQAAFSGVPAPTGSTSAP